MVGEQSSPTITRVVWALVVIVAYAQLHAHMRTACVHTQMIKALCYSYGQPVGFIFFHLDAFFRARVGSHLLLAVVWKSPSFHFKDND